MTSSSGQYVYVSPGRDAVCGLFIIGSVSHIVAMEFTDFNIDCDDNGLLVVCVYAHDAPKTAPLNVMLFNIHCVLKTRQV